MPLPPPIKFGRLLSYYEYKDCTVYVLGTEERCYALYVRTLSQMS
jgi:hypothetical protein